MGTTLEEHRPAGARAHDSGSGGVDGVSPRNPTSGNAPEAEPGVAGVADRRARSFVLLVAVLALSPFLVAVVALLRQGGPPGGYFGDRAVIALTAADVWHAPVLLGPYSRFYWHHPGPLYFYVLGVGETLFGGQTLGLVLAATAVNLASAAGVLWLACRRGGRALALWSALVLVGFLAVIGPVAFDIWNPSVTLLPFALVLMLAWSVAVGDWWAAPWLVVAGSFAVQTHVGLAPGVATALGFALVVGWRRVRSEGERSRWRPALLVSVAVGVIAWLPPLIQQFTEPDGNLGELAQFFLHRGSEHSFSDGVRATAGQVTLELRGLVAGVTLRSDHAQGVLLATVVTALAFVGAAYLARRAGSRDVHLLLALVACEAVVGVYAVTRIADAIQFYLVEWIGAAGLVLWIAVGAAVIATARGRDEARRLGPRRRTILAAALALAVAVGAVAAYPVAAHPTNDGLVSESHRTMLESRAVSRILAVTRGESTVVLRLDHESAWEILATDALLLEQRGKTVRIVESPVTRLLFDEGRLVAGADSQVFAFRERGGSGSGRAPGDSELVASQGRWRVDLIRPR